MIETDAPSAEVVAGPSVSLARFTVAWSSQARTSPTSAVAETEPPKPRAAASVVTPTPAEKLFTLPDWLAVIVSSPSTAGSREPSFFTGGIWPRVSSSPSPSLLVRTKASTRVVRTVAEKAPAMVVPPGGAVGSAPKDAERPPTALMRLDELRASTWMLPAEIEPIAEIRARTVSFATVTEAAPASPRPDAADGVASLASPATDFEASPDAASALASLSSSALPAASLVALFSGDSPSVTSDSDLAAALGSGASSSVFAFDLTVPAATTLTIVPVAAAVTSRSEAVIATLPAPTVRESRSDEVPM